MVSLPSLPTSSASKLGDSLAITMSSGVNSLPRKPWFCMWAAMRRTFLNSGLYM